MRNNESGTTRWYREPYAWLVVLLPAIAVVAGFYTLGLAIVSDDGLVTDDYYKRGLEINRVLARDERAKSLAIDAQIFHTQDAHTFTARMQAHDVQALPASLHLKLMHSTRAGFDHDVALERTADGSYFANLPPLPAGRWYAQIETADWRILKSFTVKR
jgi:hypothetical protein